MTASEAVLMERLPSGKNRALLDGFVASRAFAFSTFCCDTIFQNTISMWQSTNSSLITHQGRFSLPLDLGLQSWGSLEVCRSDCPASSPSLPPSCSQPGYKSKIIVSQSPSWTRYMPYDDVWCVRIGIGALMFWYHHDQHQAFTTCGAFSYRIGQRIIFS